MKRIMKKIKQGSEELKKFKEIKDIFLYISIFNTVFMNFCKKKKKMESNKKFTRIIHE